MTAITVQLNDDIAQELRRLAEAQERSETEIVCEALAAYVQPLGLCLKAWESIAAAKATYPNKRVI